MHGGWLILFLFLSLVFKIIILFDTPILCNTKFFAINNFFLHLGGGGIETRPGRDKADKDDANSVNVLSCRVARGLGGILRKKKEIQL